MVKENISLTQLFMLIFNYLLGSAIVIGVGKEAKQDAWIAIALTTLIGIGLMYFYYSINRLLPNKNLFEIMEYCFTRPITILLSLVYVIYFLYTITRVIRTFGEMITSAILPNTPIEVITLSIMLVIAYIVYLGLEVLARITEIFTPYVVMLLTLIFIFLVTSGEIQLHNLQPVLGDGIKPVLKAMFPGLIIFPFGELVAFTIILTSVTELKKSKKIAFIAVLTAGTFLAVTSILMINTLGVDAFQYSNFPLLSTTRVISIGHFLERIDPLVVFIMTLGVIVKCAVFIYCGLKGLEYVFRIPYRYFAIPISVLVSVFSILVAVNYGDHLEKLKSSFIFTFYGFTQLIIPIMTILILIWKTKKHNSAQNEVK
jgi:spore germination protein KB